MNTQVPQAMPVETATYLADLNPANPPATDPSAQGDDHLRLTKSVLKATFPNFTSAALASTQAQLDAAVASVTGSAVSVLAAGTVSAPGASFVGDSDTGVYSPAANEVAVTVGGQKAFHLHADKSAEFPGALAATGAISGPGSVHIGATVIHWTDTLPTTSGTWGWCNGQAVSRASFATLFGMLGTTYGAGDGSTTFNLPDLRDAVPVGKGTMGGTGAIGRITNFVTSTLGNFFGECLHLLTTGELPAHTHANTLADGTHTHTLPANGGPGGGSNTANSNTNGAFFGNLTTNPSSSNITLTNASVGGGTTHNNVQPSLVCNWIMRLA